MSYDSVAYLIEATLCISLSSNPVSHLSTWVKVKMLTCLTLNFSWLCQNTRSPGTGSSWLVLCATHSEAAASKL